MPDSRDDDDSLLRAIARAPNHALPGEENDPRIGSTIRDKYTIDRVLGEGGMAIVYEATHRNRKKFAIKMLKSDVLLAKSAQSRFVREGYVANTVGHAGAVSILDDDVTEDGVAFIVMELLEGAPLDRVCDSRHESALPPRAVISIGVQLLDVLAAAHAKSIIHRDIKPQNLFLTRDGAVKVLDFGVARLRDGMSRVDTTESGLMIGTPAFMAPEQALGKTDDIAAETDIWGVGATLFFMLSGSFVHEGATGQEIAVKSATTPARSLATVAARVPKELVAIVDRALAFDKSARWPNATAMRDALGGLHVALYREQASKDSLIALLDSEGDAIDRRAVADTLLPSSVAPARRARRPWIAALAIAGFASIVFFFLRPRGAPDLSAPPPSAVPSITSMTIADPAIAASTTIPAMTASTVITATTPTAVPTSSMIATAPKAPKTAGSASSVHAPSACDPPYTVDAVGKRVPKPACL
jgi:eukaryotic-like serine/threonine-protein kinase